MSENPSTDDYVTPEPRFYRKGDGAVHVLSGQPVEAWLGGPMSVAEHLARQPIGKTLCGLDGYQRVGSGEVWTFPDDVICRRCAALWPHEQHLLFAHDVPSEVRQ